MSIFQLHAYLQQQAEMTVDEALELGQIHRFIKAAMDPGRSSIPDDAERDAVRAAEARMKEIRADVAKRREKKEKKRGKK